MWLTSAAICTVVVILRSGHVSCATDPSTVPMGTSSSSVIIVVSTMVGVFLAALLVATLIVTVILLAKFGYCVCLTDCIVKIRRLRDLEQSTDSTTHVIQNQDYNKYGCSQPASQRPFLQGFKQKNSHTTNYSNHSSTSQGSSAHNIQTPVLSIVPPTPTPSSQTEVASNRDGLISPHKMITEDHATAARETPPLPRVIPPVNPGQSTLKIIGATPLFPVTEEHYDFNDDVTVKHRGSGNVANGSAMMESDYDFDETLTNNHVLDLRVSQVPKSNLSSRPYTSKPSSTHDQLHPYETSEKFTSQNHSSKFKVTSQQRDWSTLPSNQTGKPTPKLKPITKLKPWKERKRPQDNMDIDPMYATPHTRRQSEIRSEGVYQEPAKDRNSLYAQFSKINVETFSRESIRQMELLGSGQFGKVRKGEWHCRTGRVIPIAVKTLSGGEDEYQRIKFLQEAAIMGQFSHPNVVKLYGVVTVGEPEMIILEVLPRGDLRKNLLALRTNSQERVSSSLPHTLLGFCRQIASGMLHLSSKAFVHRDLAARNILISEDGVCKVADFGMARDLMEADYYVSHGGEIPVKWTALEALNFRKYSTASDVWSFGCVMYEIWSLGHKPFEGYSNLQAVKDIQRGYRLPSPPGCPRAIYNLMINCWHPTAVDRPTFDEVAEEVGRSPGHVLKWTVKDKATHLSATQIGAELDVGYDLYRDLQNTYLV